MKDEPTHELIVNLDGTDKPVITVRERDSILRNVLGEKNTYYDSVAIRFESFAYARTFSPQDLWVVLQKNWIESHSLPIPSFGKGTGINKILREIAHAYIDELLK